MMTASATPNPTDRRQDGEGDAPRAYFDSDAATIRLPAHWRFQLVSGSAANEAQASGTRGTIDVPGHWQLQGHGEPAYTNVRYPFPVDPPHVPDDNPAGEYRTTFDLPSGWPGGAAVLRFLGVDSLFTAWLNGTEVGSSSGSRLTTEFAVGELLRREKNELTVLV